MQRWPLVSFLSILFSTSFPFLIVSCNSRLINQHTTGFVHFAFSFLFLSQSFHGQPFSQSQSHSVFPLHIHLPHLTQTAPITYVISFLSHSHYRPHSHYSPKTHAPYCSLLPLSLNLQRAWYSKPLQTRTIHHDPV